MTTKLYYVRADDIDGSNADAYVWARDPRQAGKLCQRYWTGLSGGPPNHTQVLWVDEVPTIAPRRGQVVHWENIVRHENV